MKEDRRKNNGGKRREGLTKTNKKINLDNDLLSKISELEINNLSAFVNEAVWEKIIKFEKQSPHQPI